MHKPIKKVGFTPSDKCTRYEYDHAKGNILSVRKSFHLHQSFEGPQRISFQETVVSVYDDNRIELRREKGLDDEDSYTITLYPSELMHLAEIINRIKRHEAGKCTTP